jgi:hypothetical protein
MPRWIVFNRNLCEREEDPPEKMILLHVESGQEAEQPLSMSALCFLVGAMAALAAFQMAGDPMEGNEFSSQGKIEESTKEDGTGKARYSLLNFKSPLYPLHCGPPLCA